MAGSDVTAPSSLSASAIPQIGLFDRLFRNPILIRELRVGGRSVRILVAHAICLLVQAFIFIVVTLLESTSFNFSPKDLGTYTFIAESIVLLIITCTVFPAFSCTAIVSEKERNCLDLLSMTHFEPWELVWGKLLSALLHSSLFALSAMPIYVLSVTYGGFPAWAVVIALVTFIPVSLLLAAFGIYMSAVVKRPMAAMAATYMVSFGLGLLLFFASQGALLAYWQRNNDLVRWMYEGSAGQRALIAVAIVGSLIVNTAFLIASSVVRLKLDGEDKATLLRVLATISALLGMLLLGLGYQFTHDIGASVYPTIMIVAMSLVSLVAIMPGIKVTGESAFAPRAVARRFAALPQPMRFLRWLFGPGSTPALVLSTILVGLSLTALASFATAGIVTRAETAEISELRNGISIMSRGGGSEDAVVSIREDHEKRLQALEAAPLLDQAAIEATERLYRDAYASIGWLPWKMLATALLVLLAFGGVAWWLSFSPRGTRAATIWGISALVAMILLPLWVGAIVSARTGIDVSPASPARLWYAVVESSVITAAEQLEPGAAASKSLAVAKSENSTDLLIGYSTLLAILGLAFTMGFFKRRKALELRRAHNGRWPIPYLPPPREFVMSKQTGLAPAGASDALLGHPAMPETPPQDVPWAPRK